MDQEQANLRRRFAERTAAPMFWLSLLFLANTAALIVVQVDVPRVSKAYRAFLAAHSPGASESEAVQIFERMAAATGEFALYLAAYLWIIFVLEMLCYLFLKGKGRRLNRGIIMNCLCPPLRLASANPEVDGMIWLPRSRWTRPTDSSREQLDRVFGLPMLVIALMIVPVLLIEFGFREQISARLWLRALLHISTGVIWFAFAVEFILMYSFAAKKLRYCKDHWVDLAIILLPLVSFLRSLRFVRATRLARLAQLQHLSKMGRTYRLRGLVVKALRAVLLFEVLYRVLGISPERRVRGLREKLAEKEKEVESLKQQIAALEETITAKQALESQEAAFTTEDVSQ